MEGKFPTCALDIYHAGRKCHPGARVPEKSTESAGFAVGAVFFYTPCGFHSAHPCVFGRWGARISGERSGWALHD